MQVSGSSGLSALHSLLKKGFRFVGSSKRGSEWKLQCIYRVRLQAQDPNPISHRMLVPGLSCRGVAAMGPFPSSGDIGQ